MLNGTVKWFDNVKGYGFIQMDGEDRDIFVHYKSIVGPESDFKTLFPEEEVEFRLKEGPKGLYAEDVDHA